MSSNDKSTKNSPAPGPTSEIVAYRLTRCIVGLTGSASFAVFLVTGLSMQLCVGLVLRDRPMAIQAFNQTITITTDSKTAVRKRTYLTCLTYLTCPSFCFPLEPYQTRLGPTCRCGQEVSYGVTPFVPRAKIVNCITFQADSKPIIGKFMCQKALHRSLTHDSTWSSLTFFIEASSTQASACEP